MRDDRASASENPDAHANGGAQDGRSGENTKTQGLTKAGDDRDPDARTE